MSVLRRISDQMFGYDVFISYARRDAGAYAAALRRDLGRYGYRCFLDQTNFPPGSSLRMGLERDLGRSQAVIVVASPGALASEHVRAEVATFRRRRPDRRLVPISIGRTLDDAFVQEPLRIALGDTVWVTEELEGFRAGAPTEPVRKSLLNALTFTRTDARRLRGVSAAAAVLLVLTVAAVGFGIYARSQQNNARRMLSNATAKLATERIEGDRVEEGLAYLARAVHADSSNAYAADRLLQLLAYRRWPIVGCRLEHPTQVVASAIDRAGKVLATLDKTAVRLWNPATCELSATLQAPVETARLVFDREGNHLASATAREVRVWTIPEGKPASPPLLHDQDINALAFTGDSTALTVGCGTPRAAKGEEPENGYVQFWDATTWQPIGGPLDEGLQTLFVACSEGQPLRCATGTRQSISVWQTRSKTVRRFMKYVEESNGTLMSLAFSNEGHHLVGGFDVPVGAAALASGISSLGFARMWDLSTRKLIGPSALSVAVSDAEGPAFGWNSVTGVAAHGLGRELVLASASVEQGVHIWRAAYEDGAARFQMESDETISHTLPVKSVLFSRDHDRLLSVAADERFAESYARVWRTKGGDESESFEPLTERIEADDPIHSVSTDGAIDRIVTSGSSAKALVWSVTEQVAGSASIDCMRPRSGDNDDEGIPTFAFQGSYIDALGSDNEVTPCVSFVAALRTWRRARHERGSMSFQVRFDGQEHLLPAVIDGRGDLLVLGVPDIEREDSHVDVWDLVTLRRRFPSFHQQFWTQGLTLAPANDRLLVVSSRIGKGYAQIYSLSDGKEVAPPIVPGGTPLAGCFSSDGRRLALATELESRSGTTRVGLWDAETGSVVLEPTLEAEHCATIGDPLSALPLEFQDDDTWIRIGDQRYPVFLQRGNAPSWLPKLALAISGREVDDAGVVRRTHDRLELLDQARNAITPCGDAASRATTQYLAERRP